jgi:hypothetical protein
MLVLVRLDLEVLGITQRAELQPMGRGWVRGTSRSTPAAKRIRGGSWIQPLRNAAAGLSDTAALRRILAGCENVGLSRMSAWISAFPD